MCFYPHINPNDLYPYNKNLYSQTDLIFFLLLMETNIEHASHTTINSQTNFNSLKLFINRLKFK